MAVYEELLSYMTLLPQDKQKMLDRGFTEQDCADRKWKSCHLINAFVVAWMMQRYGGNQLRGYNVTENDDRRAGQWLCNRQLLEPNVLIPYVADNVITKIRPHKRGFPGDPAQVYRAASAAEPAETCVIAESEFKADAAAKLGFSAVGIPGISSMSAKNWEYFVEELKKTPAQQFVICFDNEVKDNPAYKNFKADWRKRYDTIFYSYAMAHKISEAGFRCRIATLPDEWMENGKIDIDGALKQGRTAEDFRRCIEGAVGPRPYLENVAVPKKHKDFLQRRIRRFLSPPTLQVKFNSFFRLDEPDEKGKPKPGIRLSNFTLRIKNTYEELYTESPGLCRDVVLTDEYGVESALIPLPSKNMAAKNAFREWLLEKGAYLFYGKDEDINRVWEFVFNHDDSDLVYLIPRCGFIKEFNFWLFRNVLIRADGSAIYPDEIGIFWVDSVGYRVQPLDKEDMLPSLVTTGEFDEARFVGYLEDGLDAAVAGTAKLALGWFIASLFADEIFEAFNLFPILFLYGHTRAGKTTVLRWLMSAFGQGRAARSLALSTPVGISRSLGFYSSLPFMVDDWRDTQRNQQYIPLLLGTYNRQSGAKGMRTPNRLRQQDVRSTLALAGEEVVNDNAVMSRCLSFYVPSARRKERGEELEAMTKTSSLLAFKMLTTWVPGARATIVNKIKEAQRDLAAAAPGTDSRILTNYAIAVAAFNLWRPTPELVQQAANVIGTVHKNITETDKIHEFANEFAFGAAMGLDYSMYEVKDGCLIVWLRGVCDYLAKLYNRHTSGATTAAVLFQHFAKQDYAELGDFEIAASVKPGSVKIDLAKAPDSLARILRGSVRGLE